MQQRVIDQLQHVQAGAPQAFRNLTVVPLLAREPRAPGYVTLDEALGRGWGQVTEVNESGSVPELLFRNEGAEPVLLLDGEELIGAKQNRVLNLTILAAPHSTLVIPVSCVEAGRWHRVSSRFEAAPRAQFAEGRAAKMRHVTESLHVAGSRRSNQHEVWSAIDAKAARLGARSETGAMQDIFTRHAARVEDYVAALPVLPNQVGAVFAVDGQVRGLELFDAPDTWRKLSAKLVRSYAIDAIDSASPREGTAELDVRGFMDAIAASQVSSFPATGVGTDVRLESPVLHGAALVADGRAVHLSVFATVS